MSEQISMENNIRRNRKLLSPKLDVVFQEIFGEERNERITKSFLEAVLKEPIDSIDLSKNPILRREFEDDKLGILDILAEVNGREKVNIELQVVNQDNIIERILYYWSRLFTRQINKGEDYQELPKTIVILITDYIIDKLKEEEYHSSWKIMETENKTILTEKLELHIIMLPKIMGQEENKDKLLDWLYFIANPKSERVKEKMNENEELKDAVKELNRISEDEKMQRIADLREKAILDEKAIYRKGLKDGIEEGKTKREKEIATKLLIKGIKAQEIADITGLTVEEIEKL